MSSIEEAGPKSLFFTGKKAKERSGKDVFFFRFRPEKQRLENGEKTIGVFRFVERGREELCTHVTLDNVRIALTRPWNVDAFSTRDNDAVSQSSSS